MNTVTVIKKRILELCRERNISPHKLAEISAMPPSSLKSILNGKSNNPGVVTIKILCDGLGITLAEFFDTTDFNSLEQEIK